MNEDTRQNGRPESTPSSFESYFRVNRASRPPDPEEQFAMTTSLPFDPTGKKSS